MDFNLNNFHYNRTIKRIKNNKEVMDNYNRLKRGYHMLAVNNRDLSKLIEEYKQHEEEYKLTIEEYTIKLKNTKRNKLRLKNNLNSIIEKKDDEINALNNHYDQHIKSLTQSYSQIITNLNHKIKNLESKVLLNNNIDKTSIDTDKTSIDIDNDWQWESLTETDYTN